GDDHVRPPSPEVRTSRQSRPFAQPYSAVGPQVTQWPEDGQVSRPAVQCRPPSDVSRTAIPGSQSRAGASALHCDGSVRCRKRASTEPPERAKPSKFTIEAPGGTGTSRHVRPPSIVK